MTMKRTALWLMIMVASAAMFGLTLVAQEPTPPQEPAQTPPQEGATPAAPAGRGGQRGEPRPYAQVITRDAKTDTGVFDVHKVRETYYYEIPKAMFGKEFLWVSQIARNTEGAGYGGQALGSRVVKWERRDNRVLLVNVDYRMVADKSLPIARAVSAANNDTIIMSFNVEANGKEDKEAAVIDVTRLFTTDVPEFSARGAVRGRGMDNNRSFIMHIKSFPENIEAESTLTYTSAAADPLGGGGGGPVGRGGGGGTVVLHHSMVKLPDKPMTPRLFDERVGYFTVSQLDFGQDEHRAPRRRYIARYRLEKKDPNAEISEPVKPIVYYIDPATPTKWVPYLKKGIESWNSAFETAGFKNAIVAKEAPSPGEDPEWSPEDARYSVVRWLPSTTENASGPHISDPRTGEIIEADIQFHQNVMNLARDWYFVQAGPLDPRAKQLPLPDELMGRLLMFVVAHEIGHTLGLQHNMKASSMYPAEKVHDREWVKTMGHTPSIMDYSRFNYVAQPEDHIDVQDLVPGIGPYDKFAIMWGYKPIPNAKTADDEKPALDLIARQQDTTPWLRFSIPDSQGADPGDETEAVGDADAVASGAFGMKNLQRVGDMMLTATSTKKGDPYDELEEIYGRLLGQWVLEMNHVSSIVGGFESQQKHIGQQGVRFTPVARQRQVDAVKFLHENAFKRPLFAVDPEILRRIEPAGVLSRVRTSQVRVLNTLLNNARIDRLIEQEAIDGDRSYKPLDFLGDVRKGIWSELTAAQVKIDAYRRNLQHSYIDVLSDKVNGRVSNDDIRSFARGELTTLRSSITTALAKTTDRATRLHLEDAQDQIAKALDPKFARTTTTSNAAVIIFGVDGLGNPIDPLNCFPDYAIRLDSK